MLGDRLHLGRDLLEGTRRYLDLDPTGEWAAIAQEHLTGVTHQPLIGH